jgi:hypothetical protein
MNESKTEKCVRLLDEIFLFKGKFDYNIAWVKLHHMRNVESSIDAEEYENLLEALESRRENGHYEYSRIYQRAKQDETEQANSEDLQEWELHYTYFQDGKSGFLSLVTCAKSLEDAKKRAAEGFKLSRANVVFWSERRLK